MTTLRQLIQDRMSIPGHEMSLDDVVEKAQKAGEKLGRSNLHKLTKEAPLSLTRATIYGLAAGLGVTPLTVANAAIESMGIATRPIEVTDTLTTAAIDPTLSEQDRKYLSTLIREMRNANSTAVSRPQEPRAPRETKPREKTRGKVTALPRRDQVDDVDEPAAARWGRGKTKGEQLRDRDAQLGEESQVAPDEED
ncbi:immunity repressor [Gordonia phage RavenCo17]|nr:immunity repressor [Gordonia phage RavenCo17]